jgi:hypothetical protein
MASDLIRQPGQDRFGHEGAGLTLGPDRNHQIISRKTHAELISGGKQLPFSAKVGLITGGCLAPAQLAGDGSRPLLGIQEDEAGVP